MKMVCFCEKAHFRFYNTSFYLTIQPIAVMQDITHSH